jgi:hypothetical protein
MTYADNEPIETGEGSEGSEGINEGPYPDIELSQGSSYLMVLEEQKTKDKDKDKGSQIKGRYEPFLVKMTHYDEQEGIATLIDEKDRELLVGAIPEENRILLIWSTEGYTISDILPVVPYEPDKDGYVSVDTEIEIETEEIDESAYVYSDFIKTDDILSSLIQLRGIYGKELKIKEAQEASQSLMRLSLLPEIPYSERIFEGDLAMRTLPPSLIPQGPEIPEVYDEDGQRLLTELQEDEQGTFHNKVESSIRRQSLLSEDDDGIRTSEYVGGYAREGANGFTEAKNHGGIREIVDGTIRERVGPRSLRVIGFLNSPFLDDSVAGVYAKDLKEDLFLSLHRHNDLLKGSLLKDILLQEVSLDEAGPEEPELSDVFTRYSVPHDLSLSEVMERLANHLPTKGAIIQGLQEDSDIAGSLHNLTDITVALGMYGITYGDCDPKLRKILREILHTNAQTSKKGTKVSKDIQDSKGSKGTKDISHEVPIQSRVKLALRYILGLKEEEKRPYLEVFIDKFTREPDKSHEKPMWLYNRFTEDPLLCRHNLYHVKATNDNHVFQTMLSIFGQAPQDGVISCKVCGEMLSREEESLVEGYDGGQVVINKQVISESDGDKLLQTIDRYLESHQDTVSLLRTLGSSLGVDLPDPLVYEMSLNRAFWTSRTLAEIRYAPLTEVWNTHPRIKILIEECKAREAVALKDSASKKLSKSERKALKKQYEAERSKIRSDFRTSLNLTNDLLMNLALLIVYIQSAVPSLSVKRDYILRIIDMETKGINQRSLEYILQKLKRITDDRPDDPTWKACKSLFSDTGVPGLKEQLQSVILCTLEFPQVIHRWKGYTSYLEADAHVYVKPEWPTFKPLSENSLVTDVAKQLGPDGPSNDLLKTYSGYPVENISLLRTTRVSYEVSVAKHCKIPTLAILQNQAFLQMFRYTVACYGIHETNPKFSLLLADFLATTDAAKQKGAEAILKKHKVSASKSLDFHVLRKFVIPELLALYGEDDGSLVPCYRNEALCNHFVHMNINNYDSTLLNTYPKRIYRYTPPNVYPTLSYKRLQEEQPQMVEALFQKYRLNVVGDIVRNRQTDTDYDALLARIPEIIGGAKDLPETTLRPLKVSEEMFHKVLTHQHLETELPYHPTLRPIVDYTTEDYDRLRRFSGESRLLQWCQGQPPYEPDYPEEPDPDEIPSSIVKRIARFLSSVLLAEQGPLKDRPNPQFLAQQTKDLFATVRSDTRETIRLVSSFFIREDVFTDEQKVRFRKSVPEITGSLDASALRSVFETWLSYNGVSEEPSEIYESLTSCFRDIRHILVLVSMGSKGADTALADRANHVGRFDYPVKATKARWKITDTTVNHLQSFTKRKNLDKDIETYDLLLHNDVFVDSAKAAKAFGFQEYLRATDGQSAQTLGGLLAYLLPYLSVEDLRASASVDSLYTARYSAFFMKYQLMIVFQKITEYIRGIEDTLTEIDSEDANLLYAILADKTQEELQQSLTICKRFLGDILTHLLMTHYDPQWNDMNLDIHALQTRLSKRKEREKQQILITLDGLSPEERILRMEKEKAGLSSIWKDVASQMKDFVQSEDYAQMNEDERKEHLAYLQGQMATLNEALNEVQDGDNPGQIPPQVDVGDLAEHPGFIVPDIVDVQEDMIPPDIHVNEDAEDDYDIDEDAFANFME